MIARDHITEWRQYVPWLFDNQVEQDLLISRVLVELFSDEEICRSLAFRGGTAIYKLFLAPAPRYSEDIRSGTDQRRTYWTDIIKAKSYS